MLEVGSVVGAYRLERVLGSGAMGTVYLARNQNMPRYDAVKVLPAELSRDAGFRARFIREADIVARLNHPNIVRVYDRGESQTGELWIAMQYVDGANAGAAALAGEMPPARAVHVVTEVAHALDYAHDHGVLHRDIKPENILLSASEPNRVLLGDFGIAREADDTHLTAVGSMIATTAYAAPEVISGQPVDGRADLYSLGCTLFRLFTGKTPFWSANGIAAMLAAHLYEPPPRVTPIVPQLPATVDSFMAIALAKDPAHRFQSGREFASGLAAAMAGTEPPMRRPSFVAPGMTPPPGNPPHHGHRQPPYGTSPQPGYSLPAQRKSQRPLWIAAGVLGAVVLVGGGVAAVASQSGPGHTTRAKVSTTTTTTTSTLAPVPLAGLNDLLLGLDQVSQFDAATGLSIMDSSAVAFDNSTVLPNDKDCISAFFPIQVSVLQGSSYTMVQSQLIGDPKDHTKGTVVQAVIGFPSGQLASNFLAAQQKQFGACANRHVVSSFPAPNDKLVFGTPATTPDGFLTMVLDRESNNLIYTERALGVRNNVVVDVAVFGSTVSDTALRVAQQIAAKVPTS